MPDKPPVIATDDPKFSVQDFVYDARTGERIVVTAVGFPLPKEQWPPTKPWSSLKHKPPRA